MIHKFKGTKTPFIEIKGKRTVSYVNPEHITSITVFDDRVKIFVTEMDIEDGYGKNAFYDITLKEFKEIFE